MDHHATSEGTEERLERASQTMAVVFDHYGDVYWPVFEALKRVLDEKRARRRERLNTGLRAMQDRHRFWPSPIKVVHFKS